MRGSVWSTGAMIMTVEKPKHPGKKKLSQCHFVHHTSHMEWPEIRFPSDRLAINCLIMAQSMSCRKKVRNRCSSSSFRKTACIERYGYQMTCAE